MTLREALVQLARQTMDLWDDSVGMATAWGYCGGA